MHIVQWLASCIVFCRTQLTSMLASEIDGVDSTDILVLNQEVVNIGFGFQCVDVTMRVLGPTRELINFTRLLFVIWKKLTCFAP